MARQVPSPVNSVTEFMEAIWAAQPEDGFLTFRGHSRTGWKIKSAIQRTAGLEEHEKEAVRDLLSIHPREFAVDTTMFDRLVRMQHFGLPTRLLDVTGNPLVALYFASRQDGDGPAVNGEVVVFLVPNSRKKYFDSDAISCVSNLANLTEAQKSNIRDSWHEDIGTFNQQAAIDRLIQFIRAEKPYFRPEIHPNELFRANYVVPKLDNRRIVAQAGAFLIYGLAQMPAAKSNRETIKSSRIKIAATAKDRIRKELDMLGINESTLFPEIERAAGYIVERYKTS